MNQRCVCICSLFRTSFLISHRMGLSRVPYARSSLGVYFIHGVRGGTNFFYVKLQRAKAITSFLILNIHLSFFQILYKADDDEIRGRKGTDVGVGASFIYNSVTPEARYYLPFVFLGSPCRVASCSVRKSTVFNCEKCFSRLVKIFITHFFAISRKSC